MFLRNDSDQMSSSGSPYTTTQRFRRPRNKLLARSKRQSNSPPPTASPPTSKIPWLKPPARALVVGINEYKAEGISNLSGCLEDADNVMHFLTEELGMERSRILLLTSPADKPSELATRAAIIEGLRVTLNQTPAGEEVLFYYSGHGSTCQLASEISFGYQKGNTLVPMDARQNGVLDIMNRELRYLIAEAIEVRGVRFTMISDSCHSGELLRNDGKRFTEPNNMIRDLDSLLDGINYERLAELYDGRTLPYTLIAGCLPHQSSYEIRRDGKVQGAMTSTLLEVLRTSHGALSYQELGRAIRGSIPKHPQRKNQYPNVIGVQDRLIFGTDKIVRRQALFVVQQVFRDNTIRVEASKPNELSEGSILTSFTDFTFTKKVAQWEVTEQLREREGLRTTVATKMWGADAKLGTPLLLERSLSRPTLYFDSNTEPVAKAWRTRQPPKRVYLHEIPINDAYITVQAVDKAWVVRQRDGNILMRQPQTPHGTEQIAKLIDQVVSYKDFEALFSPSNQQVHVLDAQPRVNLTATLLDYTAKKEIALAVGEHPLEPFPYSKRAQIRLAVSNPTSQRVYVYPYLLDSERYEARCLLFSNEEAELAAGDSRTITYPLSGDTLSLRLKLLVSRHPLVLQVSPNDSEFLPKEFRVSATLPFMPHLTDWDIQSLLVSYDKEAPVRRLSSRTPPPRAQRKPKKENKPIIVSSSAKSGEEVLPPSLFFERNASAIASLWRETDTNVVRRMLYLTETRDRDAADYIIKAEGNVWVASRQTWHGNEIQVLRRELAQGRQVAELIDQVACYEQFEALAPMSDDRLPMPLLGAEAGVKLVAELRHKKGHIPLVVGSQKFAPLPAGKNEARLIVQNQSNKMLYVYLYRLEPHRHLAKLIWPLDGSAQLPAHEWRPVLFKVEPKMLKESALFLKLIVSSEPLVMEEWPCGRKGTDERVKPRRGIKMSKIRSLKPRMIGWGVQQLLVSCEP